MWTVYHYLALKRSFDPKNQLTHSTFLSMIVTVLRSSSSVKKEEKFAGKYLKIPYEFRDRNYCFLLKIARGIVPLKSIRDDNDQDVTDQVTPYLGPNLDFHGVKLTPKDLGWNSLTFVTLRDEQEYRFEADQTINTDFVGK